MELIDTLCHLDFEVFNDAREQIIADALAGGITEIIVPATHRLGWQNLLSVCAGYEALYPALGLHPMFVDQHQKSDLVELEQLIDQLLIGNAGLVAIGEIGLDYRNLGPSELPKLDVEQQQFYFEQQLLIAKEKNLPVILHILKAHDQALGLLKKYVVAGGTVHAFNGSMQQAKHYIDLGFKLGFGSMLTYERSSKLRKLAKTLPLESIVLETDAPDMTVSQQQFQRGKPAYLIHCRNALAEIRQQSVEVIATRTTANAKAIFSFRKQRQ